jgi:hypothetical protein
LPGSEALFAVAFPLMMVVVPFGLKMFWAFWTDTPVPSGRRP